MYPESYYDQDRVQQKPKSPLTLDIYPSTKGNTRFELIEDDGVTYEFKNNSMYSKTLIECKPTSDEIIIEIKGQYEGKGYNGMPKQRDYIIQLHTHKPKDIFLDNNKLKESDVWYFDTEKNIVYINIKNQKADASLTIKAVH